MALVAAAGCAAAPVSAAEPSQGRHYEVVTPADKLGQPTALKGLSPDGSVVRFSTTGGNGLPGTGGQSPTVNSYLSRRDAHQWEYFPMNLPTASVSDGYYLDATLSLDVQLFRGVIDLPTRTTAYFLRRPGLPPEQVSPAIANRGGGTPTKDIRPLYAGASADFTHIVFSAERSQNGTQDEVAYLPSDPLPEPDGQSPRKLYEAAPNAPIRRVDVDNGGVPIGGACGGINELQVQLGSVNQAERAVSADGQRIFFTTSPDCVDRRLYARIGGTSTVELSASECDRIADPGAIPPVTACAPRAGDEQYQSASADGRVVYFTSPNQLVDGDVDSTPDLYRYDFDAPSGARLSLASAGTNPTPESGSELHGVARVSSDGSRAYFAAGAVLAGAANGQGQTAVAGANNLYRYDDDNGSVHFVATLDSSGDDAVSGPDASLRPTHLADPQGRYLVFPSVARLTSDDTDDAQDIYRYDADTGQLRRVSIGREGFGSDGNDELAASVTRVPNFTAKVSVPSEVRTVSTDGQRILFLTAEALQASDVNDAPDIYEWVDGNVGLVSDGTAVTGTANPQLLETGYAISADGGTAAFSTSSRLLPERDTDTASDVYVARLGADVDPLPPPPAAPCVGAACQAPDQSPPDLPSAGSVTFAGPGNALGNQLAPAPTRLSVKKAKDVRGTRATLTVAVPGSGLLTAAGSGLASSKRRATKAGSYSVKVSLSKRARKTLAKKGTVRAKVRVTFAPTLGAKASTQVTVTFKTTSKKGRS